LKRIIVLVILLLCILPMTAFAGPADNFLAGRMYFGGSGSFSIDLEGTGDMDIYLNPDIGYFPVKNLLLEIELDMRLRGSSSSISVGTGLNYYIPLAGAVVPYAGAQLYYVVTDDFNNTDGSMWVRLLGGLDLFVTENAAFFIEARAPRYYIDSEFTSTWMYVNFGFHFFVPSGTLGSYKI